MEGFEPAFKDLGKIVADVGLALASACDSFGFAGGIRDFIANSQSNKARLLHYYPQEGSEEVTDDACGTHIDHSILTGLCSAMYFTRKGDEVVPVQPPPSAGLYIYPRGGGDAVKVSIPPNCLGE